MIPKVTVILLTCNRTTFVRAALEGLLKQTYQPWALVASDCSDKPDARQEINDVLKDFAQKAQGHEVKIIQQPGRVPQSQHHRLALAEVQSDYAAYLDDDDIYLPEHLERACAWLDGSSKRGLAVSNGRVIDGDGAVHGWTNSREMPLPAANDQQAWLRLFMSSFYGSTSGYVFRKEALKGHPFINTPMVDIHVAVTITVNGYEITGFPEASYLYRVHGQSFYASYQVPGTSLYEKGPFIVRDRHNLRLWLVPSQGLRLTQKFPLFPFLVVKSAGAVIKDICLGTTRNTAKATG
jgi:glycosyltransferase involved in cell wall biosynthesis